jgi:hypothetical protein
VASLIDDSRGVLYDCNMVIVQYTGPNVIKLFFVRNLRIFIIS